MTTQIDFTADCAYVYLPGYGPDEKAPGRLYTEFVTASVNVDVRGLDPVGVEVIGLKSEIPIGQLVRDFGIPDETIRELLLLSTASMSTSSDRESAASPVDASLPLGVQPW